MKLFMQAAGVSVLTCISFASAQAAQCTYEGDCRFTLAQSSAASDAPKETAKMPDAMDQSHQSMVKTSHKPKKHLAKKHSAKPKT